MHIPGERGIAIPRDALVVLCGPAACGKTVFAARNFAPTQIVSSDGCRAAVGDDEADQSVSGRAFDLFFTTIEHRLALGRLTVADSTALDARTRRQLRKLARRYNRPIVLIVFDLGVRRCLMNDAGRARRVGLSVIRSHRARLRQQMPQFKTEGYDQVIRITARKVNTTRIHVRQAASAARHMRHTTP